MFFLIFLTNIPQAWSNEYETWNEGWRKLLPGYTVTEPLIAAPWEYGKTVLTGAMAEHEELDVIKSRMATVEQQLQNAMDEANKANLKLEQQTSYMEENMRMLEESLNKEIKSSYKKGLVKGSAIGFIFGLGIGIFVSN